VLGQNVLCYEVEFRIVENSRVEEKDDENVSDVSFLLEARLISICLSFGSKDYVLVA
jgi:hypothetical protein